MKQPIRSATIPLLLLLVCRLTIAQQVAPVTAEQELERLTLAVSDTQAQVEASQRQLVELKKSLAALAQRLAGQAPTIASSPTPYQQSTSGNEEQQERQAIQTAQIATLNQTKVESASRYPVRIDGQILFYSFDNTHQVDVPVAPTIAIAGTGTVGASLRQTVLGIDATGPHLAGSTSHADLQIDFFGGASQNLYGDVGGLLRLRTAHATLDWSNTQFFVELDRPIISPYAPTSLTAVATPELAWSGNLWTWSPQMGVSHHFAIGPSTHLSVKAALIDVPDPPSATVSTAVVSASQAQASRKPAGELHLALFGGAQENGPSLGAGGYISRHTTPYGYSYNAWAGTLDARTPLPLGMQLTASFYRGLALGGLGGGTYKDYLYTSANGRSFTRALDDVGGWTQVKKRFGTRLESNMAFGLDNSFSKQLRRYNDSLDSTYLTLARNRTFVGNLIYSPSAYLLFSVEYRHITTYPISGSPADTSVFGLAAGYKF